MVLELITQRSLTSLMTRFTGQIVGHQAPLTRLRPVVGGGFSKNSQGLAGLLQLLSHIDLQLDLSLQFVRHRVRKCFLGGCRTLR